MIVKNNSNKRTQTIVSNVDQKIRSSIQEMWVALPDDASYEDLKQQIERLVNRALENFREDLDAFQNNQ